ncbi:hypothetical protein [Streptomyces sp. TLI_171]|uniref:hypothetical protein n=1 Tax=Streptomyces sp. TLI_171 TaxID=1938859 RepID=UPI000C1A46CB|nr:hypothetical protein [Streptomyces sp. TLI_171]RKE23517.1 hypothetical protein BX266_6989 [Streptomyces sp. TLI_171]
MTPKDRTSRPIGLALAVAACNPPVLLRHGVPSLLATAAVTAFAWWAAPTVVRRPVRATTGRLGRLAHHRNTALAAGTVAIAALGRPGPWIAAAYTALLLAYLLLTDARAAGPAGVRQLRSRRAPVAAYAATAAVLALALLPVTVDSWAPLLAVLAVAGAATAVLLAVRGPADGG